MDIKLQNSWENKEQDRWDWSAYLTGSDVSNVEYVEYILHPTFENPMRKIENPAYGFRLETSGWGTFDLKAIVHFKDGTHHLLTHNLKLEYEPKSGKTE